MNTIRNQIAPNSALFERFQAGVAAKLTAIAKIRAARQARAVTERLLTHDDRMLTDIGVSRSDIEQALSVAWDKDPAVSLGEIRRRRMQADRQGLDARRVR